MSGSGSGSIGGGGGGGGGEGGGNQSTTLTTLKKARKEIDADNEKLKREVEGFKKSVASIAMAAVSVGQASIDAASEYLSALIMSLPSFIALEPVEKGAIAEYVQQFVSPILARLAYNLSAGLSKGAMSNSRYRLSTDETAYALTIIELSFVSLILDGGENLEQLGHEIALERLVLLRVGRGYISQALLQRVHTLESKFLAEHPCFGCRKEIPFQDFALVCLAAGCLERVCCTCAEITQPPEEADPKKSTRVDVYCPSHVNDVIEDDETDVKKVNVLNGVGTWAKLTDKKKLKKGKTAKTKKEEEGEDDE